MKARKIIVTVAYVILMSCRLSAHEPNFTILQPDQSCFDQKIGYLFAHGLGANQEQALMFLADDINKWIIKSPTVLFDFPDAKNNAMEYHHEYVNLGQDLDIERLAWTLNYAQTLLPEHKFVLTGISRGAATIANFIGLYQPTSVAALVLESPFDTIKNVIKHLLKRFCVSWIPFSIEIACKIAKNNFPLLKLDGIAPLDVIHKVSSEIPILIIHSQRDKTISINSSRNLYKALVLSGHLNVYLLELASGEHGKLLYGIEADLYRAVVHAFYKKYHLPHLPAVAQIGETMLRHCQPTVEEVTKRMRKKRCNDEFDDEDLWQEYNEWPLEEITQDNEFLIPPVLLYDFLPIH